MGCFKATVGHGYRDKLAIIWPFILQMDKILHYFETMRNHCLLVFAGELNHSRVSEQWCVAWISQPSTVLPDISPGQSVMATGEAATPELRGTRKSVGETERTPGTPPQHGPSVELSRFGETPTQVVAFEPS